MASNQYVNKVVISNETVIDLTEDTIVPTVLRKGFTAHNRSGESIVGAESFIDISDGTGAGPIVELTAKGHASQVTTTGKNLLNYDVWKSAGVANGTATWENNGVTLTATKNDCYTSYTSGFPESARVLVSKGDTITLSWKANSNDSGNVFIFPNGSTNKLASANNSSAKKLTYTVASGITFVTYRFGVSNAGVTISYSDIQIELGSTATEYEPYTGGAPSPSPDYPQEIEVARGRNLFSPSLTVPNSYIHASNRTITAFTDATTYVAKVRKNTTYTISSKNSDRFVLCGFTMLPKIGDVGTLLLPDNVVSDVHTFNSGNFEYVGLYLYSTAKFGQESSVQLELGSTPTPYIPYGYVEMEVQWKNLLDTSVFAVANASTTYHVNNDGSIDIIAYDGRSWTKVPTFSLKAGTYTISRSNPLGRISMKTSVDDYTANVVYTTANSYTFTLVTDCDVKLKVGVDAPSYPFTTTVQLELGTEATEYEPYYRSTTPIPLPSRGWAGSLPDGTADILTLNGAGKVTWERKTEKFVLADLTFTYAANDLRFTASAHSLGVRGLDPIRQVPMLAQAFVVKSNSEPYDASWNGVAYIGGGNFHAHAHAYSTVTDFLAALGETQVLYPLATPVTENMGYIDLPDIPEGATISIPELDALSVKYCVDISASMLAHQYYERARSEYEDRIAALESAVAEIITG